MKRREQATTPDEGPSFFRRTPRGLNVMDIAETALCLGVLVVLIVLSLMARLLF